MPPQTGDKATVTGQLLVESVRLTAFVEPSLQLGEPTWWADLTGIEPEQRVSKPSRRELQETGAFGEQSLVLSIQPGRVDWFLTPSSPETPADISGELRSTGPFPQVFGTFMVPMLRWLKNAPALNRLAFGAVLLEPVDDKQAGYKRLSEYLPTVQIDAAGSEDFLYQINRPRKSNLGIDGLRVNRLSKWSVAFYQHVKFGIPAGPEPAFSYAGSRMLACRIELDISTPPVLPGELPRERLDEIFREMVNFAAEIGEHGDLE